MSLMLAVLLAATSVKVGSSAKISADSSYYDRKGGVAYFGGSVVVEDKDCLMHANRAYVIAAGSNDLHRIVIVGDIAITNGTKRAYGAKATYYHHPGVVFLDSGATQTAEVREETPDGERVVRGKRIKFWTEARQVEVLEAEMSAPTQGGFGRKL